MADTHDDLDEFMVDERQRFFVSRCVRGGVHVGFGRVVVTLDAEEFETVWRLLERARDEFANETTSVVSADVTH